MCRRLESGIEVAHGDGGCLDVDGSDFMSGANIHALGAVLLEGTGN